MSSPPISPLTYNASEEDTSWSVEACDTIEQIDTAEQQHIQQLNHLPTPKIGNRSSYNKPTKMSDDSVTGVLAGARNNDEVSVVSGTERLAASVWRRLSGVRGRSGGNEEVKPNITQGTSEDEESLRELEENDAFALEVGLML